MQMYKSKKHIIYFKHFSVKKTKNVEDNFNHHGNGLDLDGGVGLFISLL